MRSKPHAEFRREAYGLDPLQETSLVVSQARMLVGVAPLLADAAMRAYAIKGEAAPGVPLGASAVGPWKGTTSKELPTAVWEFLSGCTGLPGSETGARKAVAYIGFGSTDHRMREAAWGKQHKEVLKRLTAACRLQRYRIITQEESLDAETAQDMLFVAGDVPHEILFRHCALSIHHGGCGTTHAAAIAGCPQVILPVQFDNPLWATAITELKVGLALHVITDEKEDLLRPTVGDIAKAMRKSRDCLHQAAAVSEHLQGSMETAMGEAMVACGVKIS